MQGSTNYEAWAGDVELQKAVEPALVLVAYRTRGDRYPSSILAFPAQPDGSELDELAEAIADLNYGPNADYRVWDVRKLTN